MKMLDYKKIILSLALTFALFNQIKAQTETVAQINGYAKTVSRLMKTTQQRIFADVASDERTANWKEFKTEKLRDNADTGDNLNESAYVWTKNGKILAATFTVQSPSRDWAQFVNYFYRKDGTLAKAESNLNTFYGNITVERNYYFNIKGKLLKRDVKHLDLKSQKSINLKERRKENEFVDEKVKIFKNTNQLPFIKLFNRKINKSEK